MNICNKNKIITQWIGDCWHEYKDISNNFHYFTCIHCKKNKVNVNYTTPRGFFKLLDGLKKKNAAWDTSNDWGDGTLYATTVYYGNYSLSGISADYNSNLQESLIDAILKVIEREKIGEK